MRSPSQTIKPKAAVTVCRELSGNEIDSLTEKIRSGEVLLRVVAYPWGVEFDVCEFAV